MTAPSTIRVELGDRSHDVLVGEGARDVVVAAVARAAPTTAILADERVAALHAGDVIRGIERAGGRAVLVELPVGEDAKTLSVVESACRRLAQGGLERGDVVLALGGGATTDVAGFVAAVFLRGVRAYSLPTTLLAQVDAAIGGKTGVDLPEGKNLVGVFRQPELVGCDPHFLETLPEREFRAGLAEIVKAAWIGDVALLERLEADAPPRASSADLAEIVARAVRVKALVVSADEREAGRRAVLNFGHTIGHAIETEAHGRLLHGECVALGMVCAVKMSVDTGRCDASALARLVALLERLALPARESAVDTDAVLARTRFDKKRAGGRARWLLTTGPGSVSVTADLDEGVPRAAVDFLRR